MNIVKVNLNKVLLTPVETVARYHKVVADEEYVIIPYYTPDQEENFQEFSPVYVNVGKHIHANN